MTRKIKTALFSVKELIVYRDTAIGGFVFLDADLRKIFQLGIQ